MTARTDEANVTVVNHPLVNASLSILRSKNTPSADFRRALQEVSVLLLGHASAAWETVSREVETPLSKCMGEVLARPLVLVPILRAGLGMLDGMLALLPLATIGHIGVYRNEDTLKPVTILPAACHDPGRAGRAGRSHVGDGQQCLPGGGIVEGKRRHPYSVHLPGGMSCRIERLHGEHPDIDIVTAAVDPELNDQGISSRD